jgi:hypothetical protein
MPTASLSPGTRLVREWHGRTQHVDVIEGGYVFEGKTHAFQHSECLGLNG